MLSIEQACDFLWREREVGNRVPKPSKYLIRVMEERKIQVGRFGTIMILTGTVSTITTRNSEALI